MKESDEQQIFKDIIGANNPWPLVDVLKKLVEASNILLNKHDHDGQGHEEIRLCVERGNEIIKLLESRPW
jgi:hypothetical protein